MLTQKTRVTRTVVVLFACMALFAGLFVFQHLHGHKKKIDPNKFNGTLLESPREIEQFALTGTDGQPFTNESLRDQWTMIFFGFTNCGFICPTTMAELSKMYRILEEMKVDPLPRIVMISVDPERDSHERLNGYIKAFNRNFYGARGEDAMIRQMTREMGIAYTRINLASIGNDASYDMQHSGALMLFNPKGELTAFFTSPHQAAALAKDYRLLVS